MKKCTIVISSFGYELKNSYYIQSLDAEVVCVGARGESRIPCLIEEGLSDRRVLGILERAGGNFPVKASPIWQGWVDEPHFRAGDRVWVITPRGVKVQKLAKKWKKGRSTEEMAQ